MDLTVRAIERVWVDVPFRAVPARNMCRELPHWTIFELCKVTLACGAVGVGETMVYYTWGNVTDESVARTLGRSATEAMWDDSRGAGLQMALFDAVGKATGAPVHHLLGNRVRSDAALSWWSIDMPPEDWRAECAEALARGYTSYKFKARPWFDLEEQLGHVTPHLPDHFEIDLDFNTMANDSAHAARVIKALEKYHHVKIIESPIPQGDVAGNRYLRAHTELPIALHVGNPPLMTALTEEICDGFVVCGGASQVLREAEILAEANKVFWLQLVGTGITTAFALQVAAVCSHARWPAVTCQNLYQHSLLAPELSVAGGFVAIPDGPGLGVEIDWDAVLRYRIEPLAQKPYPHPDLLIRVSWPSGLNDFYAHGLQYWDDFIAGRRPVFSPGVRMELVPDDGSAQWRQRRAAAVAKPWWVPRPN